MDRTGLDRNGAERSGSERLQRNGKDGIAKERRM